MGGLGCNVVVDKFRFKSFIKFFIIFSQAEGQTWQRVHLATRAYSASVGQAMASYLPRRAVLADRAADRCMVRYDEHSDCLRREAGALRAAATV